MSDMTKSAAGRPVNAASAPSTHLGASRLVHTSVYDAEGKCLGRIEEIILDRRTGYVRFAVIALGGILGIGRKRIAVSWHLLAFDTDGRRCTVDRALLPFMAVSVPKDDPWLQRAGRTRGGEIPYLMQLLQREVHSDVTALKDRLERR